jgi:DNA (cytosine-5)-methyltransferase 1
VTATVTDLFCGAGGSSTGAAAAGLEIVMAANHWQTAIDVHQVHHPDAAHDCADITQVDPRRYPRTNILLASPECTNHSQARGISRRQQDPTLWDAPNPSAERSRATMWDVVRFAEQMHYDAIVVENVVEATKWVLWPAWLTAMLALGYEHRVLSHNSMHHGVPQSRDRIYVVFWRAGLHPDLEMEHTGWCARCEAPVACRQVWKNGRTVGRYRQQWIWTCTTCRSTVEPATQPAATIIDWSLVCQRIGDRKRPLADATRARILAGLQRYGWAPITTSGAGNVHERTPGNRARSIDEPLATQQTTATTAVATPPAFLLQTAHGGRVVDVDRPHPTVTASDDRHALIVRSYGFEGSGDLGRMSSTPEDPLPTCVTTQRPALVVTNRTNAVPRDVEEPMTTLCAGGTHHGLLMRNNGGGAEMVTPLEEPARTLTSKGHQSLLVPYNGKGQAKPPSEPLGTQPTKDRWALVDVDRLVDDCGFRMLEPYEIAAAMAFPVGYIPRDLPKKDQVKLAGNAVTPPVMTWLAGRLLQALEGAA